jgi:tricorn protease
MSEVRGYYRHPTIHGDTIVFVAEDDLWSVPATGGVARRLTANPGTVSFPVFSPDGRQLAFTGRDDGPPEAYVMDSQGGEPRRLTWFGTLTATVAWTRDGTRVVAASDAAQPFRGYHHLHAVPAAGGPAEPLKLGPARGITWQPDGPGVAIGRNSGDPARWKRYRGGTAGTLWVDRRGDGRFEPLVRLKGNLANPMWIRDRIYFLSDHEAHGNLYSVLPDGSDIRRHTDHQDYYVRFPSTDGTRIVYHAGADLFVFDAARNASKKLEVFLRSARPQRNRKYVPSAKFLESGDLHPDGHTLAAVVRGGVHAMGLWDGPSVRLGRGPGVRHRHAQWLPDGRRLVAISDEGGEEGCVVLSTDDPASSRRIEGDIGRTLELAVAPAGADRVAIANQRQEVILLDLATGKHQVVEKSPHNRIDGLAWSADGRWLAYGFPDTRRTSSIHLHDTQTGTTTRVTRSDFHDGTPSFDPEGKYLYFISYRWFDPVYDTQYFDLGFPKGARPCLITLRKDAPSPFSATARTPRAPQGMGPDASKDGKDGAKEPGKDGAKEGPTPTPPTPPVVVDLEGIEDRVVAFPVPEGRYVRVAGARGRALFLAFPAEGSLEQDGSMAVDPPAKGVLDAWVFDDDKSVTVADRVTTFSLSRGGKALLVRSGARLRAMSATGKAADLQAKDDASRETGWVDLERLRAAVVPGAEWRQMFREAWRLQRDQFWTPDLSGVDWVAVHDRYAPLVDRVASRAEFSDLMWEVQGELNTSHAYEMGGDYRPEPAWHQGFLGADLALDATTGSWKVARLPRGDSWDAARSSPLRAPGANLREGDEILAVDGEPVGRDATPAQRLVNLAGRDVRLTVKPAGGETRTIAVRALRDEQPLRYRDWVERNRAHVHAKTGGRVGYVHIPNMGPLGYSEFHRYYGAEVDREGLVVDVRWNGGGHVSQLLLEKLSRVRRGYDVSRHSSPAPYPDDAPMGPMVALTNEYAGSDGDMFSHCFKLYGLGPLVGKRTWGGVVGIWPRHALVDGSVTTQPEFAFWFRDVGFGIEGHGTDPDVEVEILPQDHAAGHDPQLERGIAEIRKLLDEKKPALPDFGPRPMRRPPALPR